MEHTLAYAQTLDAQDELSSYREKFHIPKQNSGEEHIYLCGNSLGLQPKTTKEYINQELRDWENFGVEGHFHAKNPWLPYHEFLTGKMAKVVGAKPIEVVVMNTLSVNLHLLMATFYRPTKKRYKILIESDAFPSDRYAVESQLKFHGYDNGLVELRPRENEVLLRHEDIEATIEKEGSSIALILVGCPNYYTGQVFNIKRIAELGHAKGCKVGIDLAHGAGNLKLELHNSNIDFAAWCTYKYLNSGPGGPSGIFVHQKHQDRQRLAGWWGHEAQTRFLMDDQHVPSIGASGWQISTPQIMNYLGLSENLKIHTDAGIDRIDTKRRKMNAYFDRLLESLKDTTDQISVITPIDADKRGAQVSLQFAKKGKEIFQGLKENSIIGDWREPNIIRLSPAPLYNTYEEIHQVFKTLTRLCKT